MSRIWTRQNSGAVVTLLTRQINKQTNQKNAKLNLCTIMYVDWLVELNPMCSAWILILTAGGALMRTRQVWLGLDVVGFSKTPLGEKS